jgi:hypothetical protein
MGNLSGLFFLYWGVNLVVGVVVVLVEVKGFMVLWVLVLCCLICILFSVCGLVGVYYMGLDSFGYNFGGRKVVPLNVVLLFPILLAFYNKFESLLVTLS